MASGCMRCVLRFRGSHPEERLQLKTKLQTDRARRVWHVDLESQLMFGLFSIRVKLYWAKGAPQVIMDMQRKGAAGSLRCAAGRTDAALLAADRPAAEFQS